MWFVHTTTPVEIGYQYNDVRRQGLEESICVVRPFLKEWISSHECGLS